MLEFKVDVDFNEISVVREPGKILQICVPENTSWVEIESRITPLVDHVELGLAQDLWCKDDFERSFTLENSSLKISKAD
jgi:hypothetical protein